MSTNHDPAAGGVLERPPVTPAPGAPLALAMSGGAARGMAHIGALKALEARGREPSFVAGTSYGTIIAALYALTGHALEVERAVRAQDVAEVWRQGFDFGLRRGVMIVGRGRLDVLDR